jgi:hypothetical protein
MMTVLPSANIYNAAVRRTPMTTYKFRVWLLPNPPLEFEPDTEVWRDIEIDSSQTLADFHEAIFNAFDRWDTHSYEFLTRNGDGIATRSYVHPQLYSGDPSWPPMDDAEIDRFIDQAIPDDVSEEAKERFRDLRKNPPTEADAAETTIEEIDRKQLQSLFYEFDLGDSWEHHIELQETRKGALNGDRVVVDEQEAAPPQYPDLDE